MTARPQGLPGLPGADGTAGPFGETDDGTQNNVNASLVIKKLN